jgi:phosphoglycerol transferase MdoB-like AlkP superfamily enzyme
MKPHIVFTLPVFIAAGVLLMERKKVFVSAAAGMATVMVLVIPYVATGNGAACLNGSLGASGAHPIRSLNAFNFWTLYSVAESQVQHVVDVNLGFATCTVLGVLGWLGASALLIVGIVRRRSWESVLVALVLAMFSAFFMLTSMHERYIVPAAALAALIAVGNPRYAVVYLGLSVTALASMLHVYLAVMHGIPFMRSIFFDLAIAMAHLLLLVLGFATFLSNSGKQQRPAAERSSRDRR